jgi:O-antigen/teichoic acid export membrane protein
MSSAKRLIKNSLFLYIRMFLLMGIGFFTTRKILEALGVEDLGIYNVVGSIIIMFDFVSSGLSNSTQRFINIGLGREDEKLTNQYFSQSFLLHITFAIVLALIIEPIGLWLIHNKLVIPPDRLYAATIVFHLSIISLIVRLVKICFESDIMAREQMSVFAYLSLFEGVAKLSICYAIFQNKIFDKLIYYGVLLLCVNIAITLFNIVFCVVKYKETRVKFYTEKAVFKQLASFVGINSFGVMSWALGKNGINVVMNIFFGPAINGAKALATQLDRVIFQFGTNIDTAIKPQIMKLYAKNEIQQMFSLAMKSTKYIYFVMLVVSMPLLFETDAILHLWLGKIPEYTKVFAQIVLLETLFNAFSCPFNDISLATGKIKNIQIYGRLITLSALPISYILLKISANPLIPVVLVAFLSLLYSLFIVWEMNKHYRFGLKCFFVKSLLPIFGVSTLCFIVGFTIHSFIVLNNVYATLAVNSILLICASVIIVLIFGVDAKDRDFIKQMLTSKVKRSS